MSLYTKYLEETQNINSIESEHGFITYQIIESICIIHDFFVLKEFRGSKEAVLLANYVKDLASSMGCIAIACELYKANPLYEYNLKLFKKYGFDQETDEKYKTILQMKVNANV